MEPVVRANAAQVGNVEYDFRYGETDLLENSLKRPAQTYLVITMMVLVMVGVGLVAFFIIQQPSPQDNALSAEEPLPTQTTLPLLVQTVTAGPPTATASSTPTATFTPSITPTPEPCRQRVLPVAVRGSGDRYRCLSDACADPAPDADVPFVGIAECLAPPDHGLEQTVYEPSSRSRA